MAANKTVDLSEVSELIKKIKDGSTGHDIPLSEVLRLCMRQAFLQKVFNGNLICGKDKNIRTNGLAPSFNLIVALNSEDGENVTPTGVTTRVLATS